MQKTDYGKSGLAVVAACRLLIPASIKATTSCAARENSASRR